MAITAVDKIKIHKYLKEHAIDDLYYLNMCDALCKRDKITEIEFLEYFTDLAVAEFNKEGKISFKHLTKVIRSIETFIIWIHEEKKEINEETLDKIRSLQQFYEEYLEKTNQQQDDEFKDGCISSVLKTVNSLYPCDFQSESMAKYFNQITELKKQVKNLKKQFEEVTIQYEALQKLHAQKSEDFDLLSNNLIAKKQDIKNKNQELDTLRQTIQTLNTQIQNLQSTLETSQSENQELVNYKTKYDELTSEVTYLKKTVEDINQEKTAKSKEEERKIKIKDLLYKKILFEREGLDSLVEYIKSTGIITDKNEISNLLRELKNKINIDYNTFSLNTTYKVIAPHLLKNGRFNITIPKGCEYYDIMLVSDFHIEQFNYKILSGFDILNEYCTKNGIHLILNLGDFYHGPNGKSFDYDNAKKNYEIVESSIFSIPKSEGIYHAILGGNHDRSIAKYGFDPIGILTKEREDFIHLGYKHSTINLTSQNRLIGCFDIHHPDDFDFPIYLDSSSIDNKEMNNYLSEIYEKQGRTRDDSYIDILGHTHKSQFNYPGSYCYIPSFFSGQSKKGACHLRIYFDEDTNIECMVFMPLKFATKLVKNNEIIYQKILKK